jgi:hypothetical protein
MAFGKCRRVWRVRAKQVGKCWQVWQVRAARLGECRQVWRVLHIFKKDHVGKFEYSPKMANFWRVLEFAKFVREWPFLNLSSNNNSAYLILDHITKIIEELFN